VSQLQIIYAGGEQSDQEAFKAIVKANGLGDVRVLLAPEAVAEILAHRADVLIVDVNQPSQDVLSLMRTATLTNVRRPVPVIITGSQDAAERIEACLQRGAADYLITPFDAKYPSLVARRLKALGASVQPARQFESTQALKPAGAARPPVQAPAGTDEFDDVQRFVPREFLQLLARKSLRDVRLGDHVERQMTVFFTDIRSFTNLSESMSPRDNFKFLASFLRNVTPIIRQAGGFVDKYLGDGVLALFPGEPAQAVLAATQVQRQIERYNHGRRLAGYRQVRVGIGLHYGSLMLGTIGTADQMQTTVISDAVNVASRLEGMTKTFDINVVVSGSVVAALPADHPFKLRGLGSVTAKGKTESVEVFECYDTDPAEAAELKTNLMSQWDAGIEAFREGKLLRAGRVFARIVELNPADTVAAYFRDRSTLDVASQYRGKVWDGSEHLEAK
jgi:class 3 adenylate cyclase/DNA-binding NarL/FixJ family response regulator